MEMPAWCSASVGMRDVSLSGLRAAAMTVQISQSDELQAVSRDTNKGSQPEQEMETSTRLHRQS